MGNIILVVNEVDAARRGKLVVMVGVNVISVCDSVKSQIAALRSSR